MIVAIVGSRNLTLENFSDYLPEGTEQIVSGGAKGIDESAKQYALKYGIPFREILPEYSKYGKAAPLRRNIQIIEEADQVLAVWDGKSRGTKYTIDQCRKRGIPVRVVTVK